jgi:putative heme-binding domain-containing protein
LPRPLLAALAVAIVIGTATATATDSPPPPGEPRKPWTSSRVFGTPEPPLPFVDERRFPVLTFTNALETALAPGVNRLFIVQQDGKVFSVPDDDSAARADLFIDLKQANRELRNTYGLVFHPRFAENRQFFVCYTVKDSLTNGTIVSRFVAPPGDPPRADPSSEKVIITFWSGGHNGGCLKFGPDGMLYITTGDGTGPNPPDALDTGQDVSDLLSSVLRIDVDRADPGRAYRVPPDNPFVNVAGACPEIWSYGYRNPWKMCFDPVNGALWIGDVGWELWELVFRVQRGGNYGWSAMEGPQPVKPGGKRGPTPILPATYAHPHHEAASISLGYVYRGARFPALRGALLYGDYETGKMWSLRHDGTNITSHALIADTPHRIVTYGETPAGEQYFIHYGTPSTLHRFVANPDAGKPSKFPRKLSEAGVFTNTAKQQPATGVYRYQVAAPMWSDGAKGDRFVALPGFGTVTMEGRGENAKPKFPTNAVLAKTLTLELDRGRPSSARKVETQLMHFDGRQWRAYSYRWNDAQTDATLVDAAGAEQSFTVGDPEVPGGKRTFAWRFHSRAECLRCHNSWNGFVLGFQPAQLTTAQVPLTRPATAGAPSPLLGGGERDGVRGGRRAGEGARENQFARLTQLALVGPNYTNQSKSVLVDPGDASAPHEPRARSWLHANCSACHRIHGGGTALIYLNHDATLKQTQLVDAAPTQGTFGIADARLVAPGDPYRSVLLHRLSKSGGGHMPALGSTLPDFAALRVLHDWIASLPAQGPVPATAKAESDALASLTGSTPPADAQRDAALDRLTSSVSGGLRLLHAVESRVLPPGLRALAIERALVAKEPQVRELFDRYLPDDQRVETLGLRPSATAILAKKGDRARGAKLFAPDGRAQCSNCHIVNGAGRDFGPDLSKVGARLPREQLLESMLEPSKAVDPRYTGFVAELKDGTSHTGFIVERSAQGVSLKVATGETVRLPAGNIGRLVSQQLSLMPEGLLANLTAQDAADLLAFLESLK